MEKFKPTDNRQIFLLPPSIEEFIPADHLARVIAEIVESIDVSELSRQYSVLGQKSYHPHLLLKLLFYGYATGIRSGRKIAASCIQDTAFMFLASMYQPDFRTINDFRKNNIDFIQKSFVQIIRICRALGMARTGTIIVDGTKLRANASGTRTKNKEQYDTWLGKINEDVKDILNEAGRIDQLEDIQFGDDRGDEIPAELSSKQKLREKIKAAVSELKDDNSKINLTDPDAKFIMSTSGLNLNYNCQAAVTEDGLIVAAYASNNPSDKVQILTAIGQAEMNTEKDFENILADAGYSSFDAYEKLNEAGKNIYIPDQDMQLEKLRQANPFDRQHFQYDTQTDTYTCPANKKLFFNRHSRNEKKKRRVKIYACKECSLCDKKSQCTGGNNRTIEIEEREAIRDEVRQRLRTEQGKRIYIK